eukprot:gene19272-biopygen5969
MIQYQEAASGVRHVYLIKLMKVFNASNLVISKGHTLSHREHATGEYSVSVTDRGNGWVEGGGDAVSFFTSVSVGTAQGIFGVWEPVLVGLSRFRSGMGRSLVDRSVVRQGVNSSIAAIMARYPTKTMAKKKALVFTLGMLFDEGT